MYTHVYLMIMVMVQKAAVSTKTYYCSHKRVKIFNEDGGKITTRSPSEIYYKNNIRCAWTIDVGKAHRVRITIIKIDLEPLTPGTPCEDGDFLSIKDGENNLAPVLVNICPGSTNPNEVISRGRHLHLVFKSNWNTFLDYSGIELKFEAIDIASCPPKWLTGLYYMSGNIDVNQYAGKCYRVMTKPAGGVDFLTAQKFCAYSQSNLVKVNSTVFDFLRDLSKMHGSLFNLWVGLTDKEEEGTFRWLDGSLFNSMYRMSSVSVNDNNRNCMVINFNPNTFKVLSCDEHHFFICELNLGQNGAYTVPTDEHQGEDHYTMETKDIVWICIGVVAFVAPIVLCIVLQVNGSICKKDNYSSGQMASERSIRIQGQNLHQTEQDNDATEACLVQSSINQLQGEILPVPGLVSEPSAPPYREVQQIIGPPGSDQEAPPSYWEAVNT